MSEFKPVSAYDKVRAQLEADAWQIMQEQVAEGNIPTIEEAQDKFLKWREAWMGGLVVEQQTTVVN